MDYTYVYGPDIERDFKSPLYDDVLNQYIYRLNPSLPDDAVQDALYKLKNFENGELVQKNAVFYGLLAKWRSCEISGKGRGTIRHCISR